MGCEADSFEDDLADLGSRLHTGPATAKPRGGVLRNGQRWDAADVEDVPVVDLPRPKPHIAERQLKGLVTPIADRFVALADFKTNGSY